MSKPFFNFAGLFARAGTPPAPRPGTRGQPRARSRRRAEEEEETLEDDEDQPTAEEEEETLEDDEDQPTAEEEETLEDDEDQPTAEEEETLEDDEPKQETAAEKRARARERRRIGQILTSRAARGRLPTAMHLAVNTSMAVGEARRLLASVPKSRGEAQANAPRLADRMARVDQPRLGPNATPRPAGRSDAAELDREARAMAAIVNPRLARNGGPAR